MSEWIFIIINGFKEMFKDIVLYFKKPLEMNELAENRASYIRYYIGYGLLLWTLICLLYTSPSPRDS